MTNHFNNLFVFGRPAGGKSEFIDFMKKCNPAKRKDKFHVAPFEIIDDYLFITEIAEFENILEKQSVKRWITKNTSDGICVQDDVYWGYAYEKINRILTKKAELQPKFYDENTMLIEFSRGVGISGYEKTLSNLKPEFLKNGAIIYIKVSFDESMRRNEARYQEKLKFSILAHKCPEEGMNRFYREDDWGVITSNKSSGYLKMNGIDVPFVTMNNEPEEKDLTVMEERYYKALEELWRIRSTI